MTAHVVVYDSIDSATITFSKDEFEEFKVAMARACNVWPDAPVSIKELHDKVVHGELLQDYRGQPKFTKREQLAPSENEKLDSWGTENSEAGE